MKRGNENVQDEDDGPSDVNAKRGRKKNSSIWNHFIENFVGEARLEFASCKYCPKYYLLIILKKMKSLII